MKSAFFHIALAALVATFAFVPTSTAQAQNGKLRVGAALLVDLVGQHIDK